jgi:hypothetical protein
VANEFFIGSSALGAQSFPSHKNEGKYFVTRIDDEYLMVKRNCNLRRRTFSIVDAKSLSVTQG